MFKFFKKLRENKSLKIAKMEGAFRKREAEAMGILELSRKKMLSKPCPVNDNDMCFSGCAHFYSGGLYHCPPWPGHDGPGHWEIMFPKCKLWGDK